MEIQTLNDQEHSALIDGLNLAARLLDSSPPLNIAQLQELFEALKSRGNDFPEAAIALGLAFGQVMVDETGFDWVRVNDEFGQETCVSPTGTKLICAPISMIQKRLSSDDTIDLNRLKNFVVEQINQKVESGEYDAREN